MAMQCLMPTLILMQTFVPFPFHPLVSYPLRPFWQPNIRSSSPLPPFYKNVTQLERVTQKLDKAEKKIDEYARLIASLYAELKRYQDVVCQTCRERATAASPPTNLCSEPTVPSSDQNFPARTAPGVQVAAESPLPFAASWEVHDQPPLSSPRGNRQDSSIAAASSSDNPQVTASYLSTPTPFFCAGPPQPTVPHISEQATAATHTGLTQPRDHFDWSVEYNPNMKKSLSLHITNTFTYSTEVTCTKVSRDGKYLAVGLQSGEIHVYNMLTGSKSILAERSPTVFYIDTAEPPSSVLVVRFSLDNKHIATGSSQGHINIWEVGRRRIRATFKHRQAIRCLDFSPDGRFLVSASSDPSVCTWNIRDGSRIQSWYRSFDFTSVAFSPSGRYVAAGNHDGFLRIWDVRTGQLVANCKSGDDFVKSVIFMPDGKGIAIGSGTLECWDISWLTGSHSHTGHMNRIWEFSGRTKYITAISLSSDTRWIVSGSEDYHDNVCILDARSGDWVCTLRVHTSRVWDVDFSPAGHYIVSGGQDRRVSVWRYEIVE